MFIKTLLEKWRGLDKTATKGPWKNRIYYSGVTTDEDRAMRICLMPDIDHIHKMSKYYSHPMREPKDYMDDKEIERQHNDKEWIAESRQDIPKMLELLEFYSKQLQSLINKVNKVTSYHRGGNVVPKNYLTELSNRQVEVEEQLRAILEKMEVK